MQAEYTKRLAEIRSQWEMWSALTDTSAWESTFFFEVLEQKERELSELREILSQLTNESNKFRVHGSKG